MQEMSKLTMILITIQHLTITVGTAFTVII